MICFEQESKKTAEIKEIFENDKKSFEIKAKELCRLNSDNSLAQEDTQAIYTAMKLSKAYKEDLFNELLLMITADAGERYNNILRPLMKKIKGGFYQVGAGKDDTQRYLNEYDSHEVWLDEFHMSQIPVTEEIFSEFKPKNNSKTKKTQPVTFVNWYDAYLFGLWTDTRLPTEAEWECAVRAGSSDEWFCSFEDIREYAWYAENAEGRVQETGGLRKNNYGIYDLAGNTWEWCLDSGLPDQTIEISDKENPCNTEPFNFRSTKGGSIHSFEEMLRSSFRFFDPPAFDAHDLGFRVVKSEKNNLLFI